jgi:hypothetical protein
VTWTRRTSGTTNPLNGVALGNGVVVVGDNGTVITSTTPGTWIVQSSGTTNHLDCVAFGNNIFVAAGKFGTILTSSNGVTWTPRASGTANRFHGITYANSTFVAVGDAGTVVTSSDGITWQSRTSGVPTSYLLSVAFGNNTFVVVGDPDTILQSDPVSSDTTPDQFTFTDQTNVALNTVTTSNTITVSGISMAVPISVTGGTYSINGGFYTSVPGTANNGNTVTVQQTSSGSYSTTTNATLTIGGGSDIFSVTTLAAPCDTTPDLFTFTDQTGIGLSQTVTSNSITVSGISCAAPISITGGTYSINGGAYTNAAGAVNIGNTVTVRQTSSGSYSTTTNTTLTIGSVSDTFSVTTQAAPCDTTPNSFTFTDQTGIGLSQTVTSNSITVSGITCAASISITGGTYSINGGAYTSAPGTVNNGNTVTVQQTSSGSYSTTTNATLTIGGVSDMFSVTTSASSANAWTRKADFGGVARHFPVGFSIGTKGYIGTGYDSSSRYRDFWEYDPSGNTWTQKADFGGTARGGAVGFSIGTKGYIGTGNDGSSEKKDFWQYDSILNTWTQKTDFGGPGREIAVGFSIGTKGYIGTGYIGTNQKDFWEYDPSGNTWTQKANFGGLVRSGATGFSIGNRGYLGTGNYNGTNQKDFWEYDPSGNTWTQKADFGGTARRYAVGFSTTRKGYLGTGFDGSYKKDFWEYDPMANTWTQKADFTGTSRYGTVGISVGGKGYVGLGWTGSLYLKDFWEYDLGPSLILSFGWNFISLPLTPPDTTIDQVLAPVSSKTVVIWGYDNTAKAWKKWTPAGGAGNTLLTLEPGKGYWIFMSESASLDISAWTALVAPSVALSAGWNLVGYGGMDGVAPASALAPLSGKWSVLWTWENNQWYGKHASIATLPSPIQPLSVLNQKKAFWIRMAPGPDTNWAQ